MIRRYVENSKVLSLYRSGTDASRWKDEQRLVKYVSLALLFFVINYMICHSADRWNLCDLIVVLFVHTVAGLQVSKGDRNGTISRWKDETKSCQVLFISLAVLFHKLYNLSQCRIFGCM